MNGRVFWTITLTMIVLADVTAATAVKDTATAKAPNRATVYLTASGIKVNPAKPATGLTHFTVTNKTTRAKGLVISTTDPGGTPAFRYSKIINPGQSTALRFWLYPGRSYNLKDYTRTWQAGSKRRFSSRQRSVLRLPASANYGSGPSTARRNGVITLTNNEIKVVGVSGPDAGPWKFSIANKSSVKRGICVIGEDCSGSSLKRYSKVVSPGKKTTVNLWLYDGHSYTIKDYTSSSSIPGKDIASSGKLTRAISIPERIADSK